MSYLRGLSEDQCVTIFEIAYNRDKEIKTRNLHYQVLHNPLMKKLNAWRKIQIGVLERGIARDNGRRFNESRYPPATRQAFRELDELARTGGSNEEDDNEETVSVTRDRKKNKNKRKIKKRPAQGDSSNPTFSKTAKIASSPSMELSNTFDNTPN